MLTSVLILFGFAAGWYFLSGFAGADKSMRSLSVVLFVLGLLCTAGALFCMNVLPSGAEYYLPCEIVATNETSTYFGTVDQDTQQIYAVETGDHIWPDDVPYLLHMDGKGTKTVTDDEVLMVWRAD